VTAEEQYGRHADALEPFLRILNEDERSAISILSYAEDRSFAADSINRFPQGWSGIDWERSEFLVQHHYEDFTDAARLLQELLARHALDSSLLVITWGNLLIPALAMPVALARAHPSEVLDICDDLWLFAVDEGVIIEHHHSGVLTASRIPAAPSP
jgi:hypothetical protein